MNTSASSARKAMIAFWEALLLSTDDRVQSDPNAVFFYSFVQARAPVY